MLQSIAQDIRNSFDFGNMVIKLVIINIAVFVITALTEAFFPFIYQSHILPYLAIPGDLRLLIYRPWTVLTHMFVHSGIWHLAWNMITLFWFGNIAGDLLGDRRILPVYLMGGLTGALFYILSYSLLPGIGIMALGASAAVMAIVFMAIITAPDYIVHLLLFGPVRIKYIGLVIFFIDLIGTRSSDNTGGHFAHLGGMLFGVLFVYLLRSGTDISTLFSKKSKMSPKRTGIFSTSKTKLKVAHKSPSLTSRNEKLTTHQTNLSQKVDEILDKIKSKGYESLTDEDKEILYQASKDK
ncbi:MAG: rhomboid family intramembrane serine protease [Saprospiraceae bacterium]